MIKNSNKPRIHILPENLANKIAAGEVVERPASVVKELVENAIDADARKIIIAIEQAGKNLIQIVDNGVGMNSEDIQTAFERHATSKIKSEHDLEQIEIVGNATIEECRRPFKPHPTYKEQLHWRLPAVEEYL